MKIRISFFLALLSISYLACDQDPCANVLPPLEEVYIDLVTPNGESLIANMTYSHDSLIAFASGEVVGTVYSLRDSLIVIQEWSFEENTKVLLQLSSMDTDTLDFEYLIEPLTCSTRYTLEGVKYNGAAAPFEEYEGNHKITIIKD